MKTQSLNRYPWLRRTGKRSWTRSDSQTFVDIQKKAKRGKYIKVKGIKPSSRQEVFFVKEIK